MIISIERERERKRKIRRYEQQHLIMNTDNVEGGRDSSVGIANRYGLDGPGIGSRWGRDFPHPSRPVLGPTQPPVQRVPSLSSVKRPERGADHPPPSSVLMS